MKKRLLPWVHPHTAGNVASRLRFRTDLENLAVLLRELEAENPNVARYVRSYLKHAGVRGEAETCRVAFCGLLVYQLLASQAEADVLS